MISTWPEFFSKVTMLQHMAWVCSGKIQCYGTWPESFSKVTMLRHMAWVYQGSYNVTPHGLSSYRHINYKLHHNAQMIQ